ncbi:hypothetical protein [Shinella zoogloeoides]|uniref:hypothetical protein n=1 Tax=Shinella zoogloeoides TaxID=352475 RepID=UPI00299E4A13|nr:hypothetical protein [Shinella zoogloeoides]WPE23903.1 hypothetical protein ShzoTeo12_51230 [Shinella zoogloeoides]
MKSTRPLCAALAILCQMAGQVPAYAEEAQPDAAAFELTPETLAALAECRAPREALSETGMVLFMSGSLPAWLKPVADNGHEGMLGLETFELAEPVAVFGKPVTRISFLQEWVVIEDTYDAARTLIEAKGMKRAPIKMTEQYYRFADPESGPMLGAFAPTDNALAMMLGAPAETGTPKTMFVGCNYTVASQQEFLDAAGKADATATGAGADIMEMLEGEP